MLKYAYMKTLAERTEEAIAAGFTVGALAAAAGKTSAAVSLWRSGKTKEIKADSALGLQKLTGWNWTWWVTGKGERGATQAATDVPPLVAALRALGEALALELPDEVRQDAADLLAKLALRRGAARQQQELAALLHPYEGEKSPTAAGKHLALDQLASHTPLEDAATAPAKRGAATQVRGTQWHEQNKERSISNAPRTDPQRERRPGDNQVPASKRGKT